jgi:hypothetical protein
MLEDQKPKNSFIHCIAQAHFRNAGIGLGCIELPNRVILGVRTFLAMDPVLQTSGLIYQLTNESAVFNTCTGCHVRYDAALLVPIVGIQKHSKVYK